MGRMPCTEPQCLYSTAIPLLPQWAIRPVQSLSACTVQLYLCSPYGPYRLYSASTRVHFTLPLPVVCHRLKLDGQTQYLNVKLSVRWCKKNWECKPTNQAVAPQGLLHFSTSEISMRSCAYFFVDQLQRSKLWYLKHKHELIKSQAVYLRSSLIPISASQKVSPVTRLQDKWSRAQIPAGARDSVPLHNVQSGSETHPSIYSLGTEGSFPCNKMAWVWN